MVMDWKRVITLLRKDDFIVAQAKRNKETVYGSQSLKSHMGVALAREPGDWDLFSSNPSKSARMLEKTLDRSSKGDNYFVQRSKYHKDTFKVKEKGIDDKALTDDDVQVADYTKKPRESMGEVVFDHLRLAGVDKTLSDKERSLVNPLFRHRHVKDLEDVNRVKFFKLLK